MQLHKFLHIFHLLVHRKLHPFEDARYHFFAHEVVVVECPPVLLVILLGDWLGDVVEQRCPAKPFLVRLFSHCLYVRARLWSRRPSRRGAPGI